MIFFFNILFLDIFAFNKNYNFFSVYDLLIVSSYVIKYGWNVKMQHWLNEVLIIGNNYHKRFRDFNYALEFVVGGLMRFI